MIARVASLAFLLVLTALLGASCSTTPPEIAQTFWQVNLLRNVGHDSTQERLSFFVHVTDSSGISDIDSIYLLNDKKELYWRLDSSNWRYSERNGELWVGSNSIRMPDGSSIPRGEYRVLVSNLAGERATASIFVSAEEPSPSKAAFPVVSTSRQSVTVRSSLSQTTLWVYNQIGELVDARRTNSTALPLSSLVPGAHTRGLQLTLYAYGYDKDCGCGLISGPYSVAER